MVEVKRINKEDFEDARSIRIAVFCDEQGYAREYELDEHDSFLDDTVYYVAYDNGTPVGTGRVIYCDPHHPCKIGRVAVRKDCRGKGVGRAVMQALIDDARTRGMKEILLDSQITAVGFYRALGFTECGEWHPDGHIMHINMKKIL